LTQIKTGKAIIVNSNTALFGRAKCSVRSAGAYLRGRFASSGRQSYRASGRQPGRNASSGV